MPGAVANRSLAVQVMAKGGEILVANVVRQLAEGKDFMFGDRGEVALRRFDDPVRLFEVRMGRGLPPRCPPREGALTSLWKLIC